jgi:hypothetical protein
LPINLRAVAVILGLLALSASACGLLELLFLLQKRRQNLFLPIITSEVHNNF